MHVLPPKALCRDEDRLKECSVQAQPPRQSLWEGECGRADSHGQCGVREITRVLFMDLYSFVCSPNIC